MAADAAKPEFHQPVYLGDGLYAEFDGWQIRLWADHGPGGLHEVFLEPEVLVAFLRYVEKVKAGVRATI